MGRALITSALLTSALLLFSALPASPRQKVDYRDFAIDTFYPTANEIHLAEERARSYWVRNAARFGAEPRFLAVETSTIFSSEIQDFGAQADSFTNGLLVL